MKYLFLIIIALLVFHTNLLTQTCLPGLNYFTTQDEIDNFKLNYPECTHVLGTIVIKESNITNVDSLDVLTRIDGNLNISDNPLLRNLEGLSNIEKVGTIRIMNNESLTRLNGLEKIDSSYFTGIYSNNSLISLTGLNNLRYSGHLLIGSNPRLKDLTGLENMNVSDVEGIVISNNDSLFSLNGLHSLNNVNLIFIEGNNLLEDISALNSITTSFVTLLKIWYNPSLSACNEYFVCEIIANLEDNVTIQNNGDGCNSINQVEDSCNTLPYSCLPEGITFSSQTDIDNFIYKYSYCEKIDGSVIISHINSTDLSFLYNISSIGGNLEILNNDYLEDLSGLNNLKSLGGSLLIGNNSKGGNQSLKNLSGLEGLEFIDGTLTISNNNNLNSISSIENISASSINYLSIMYNPMLGECNIENICDFLISSSGKSDIHDNQLNCNSEMEIESECSSLVEDQKDLNSLVKIYPNPSNGNLNIENRSGLKIQYIRIYDKLGHLLYINKDTSLNITF